MNEKNLRKLADHLLQLPVGYEHFDMASYCDSDGFEIEPAKATKKQINSCGTSACAVGHAPSIAGFRPKRDEFWHGYVFRLFGVGEMSDEWNWMFASFWDHVDNTPQGAALRILYALDFGVPKEFGYSPRDVAKYTNAYDIV